MPFFESFRAVRWLRTFNLLVQAVLFLTFFAGLNYVARNHSSRFDITQYHRYSLAPETLAYLKTLSQPVRIIATVSDDTDLPVEVRGLIDEFVHASEPNRPGVISREFVNVYQNRRRAEELKIEQAGILRLECADRHRDVPITELYQVKNNHGEVVHDAFIGEQRLMAAILEVSNPDQQHVYFLTGHGELQPDDTSPTRGLSVLRDELKARNFAVDTLDLSVNRRVPADAAVLVVTAPRASFTAAEQEVLRQYMTVNAGRLLFLLAPGFSSARLGLDDLLLDWGVLVFDDVVIETNPQYRTEEGDLIVRSFVPHPITDPLINYNLYLRLGLARTVAPDPGRKAGSGLTVTTVAATSTSAWGDVGHRVGLPPKFSNEGNTHPIPGLQPEGRLGLIVASERVAPRGNLTFSVPAGRLVVFGSGDFVSNQRIVNAGNETVFLSALNWCVERDREINVPPRPIERFQLAMSADDLSRFNYTLWFALPGVTALLGLIVYWTRRK